jgi:protease-4
MGRRGWAAIIVSVLFIGMVMINSFSETTDSVQLSDDVEQYWNESIIERKGDAQQKILLLNVEGVIAEGSGISGAFSASSFISQLNQAIEDDEVAGVVIRVDSPGGTVVHSEEIHDKLIEVKKSGKPIVVSMGATAASGGYYISAPADIIVAGPSTLTGSLGVIFSIPNFEKAADWIGYSETRIKSGDMKDIGNPLKTMTEQERQVFQTLVDESYNQFVDVIAKGRNITKTDVLKLADGRIYSGKQALKLKLVDKLGYLEDAIEEMAKKIKSEDYYVVSYDQPFTFESLLNDLFIRSTPDLNEVMRQLFPANHAEPRLLYLYD